MAHSHYLCADEIPVSSARMTSEKKRRAPQAGDKYILRLPEGMRDRIAESAKRYKRSMNTEIVYILQDYYDLRDYHDRIIDDAIEQAPTPLTPASAIEALSGPALEQLAELLSKSVAAKLSHRLGEQLPASTDNAEPAAKRVRKPKA